MKSKERLQNIAQELIAMGLDDQNMRIEVFEKKNKEAWNSELDRKNAQRLKEIIKGIGWPTISKVGVEASWAAWLIAQHADHNPRFQKECLALIEKAFQEKDVHPINLAYLTDRVAKNLGQEQTFGTNRKAPVRDPEHLDERRRAIGLLPSSFQQKMAEGKVTSEDLERYQQKHSKIGPFFVPVV